MPQINEVQFKDLIDGLSKEITQKLDESLKKNPASVFLSVVEGQPITTIQFKKFSFDSVETLLNTMRPGLHEGKTLNEDDVFGFVDFFDRFDLTAFELGEGEDPFEKTKEVTEDRLIFLSCVADFAYLELSKINNFQDPITNEEVDSKNFLEDYMDIEKRLYLVDDKAKKESFPK